jgi:type III secretion protein C
MRYRWIVAVVAWAVAHPVAAADMAWSTKKTQYTAVEPKDLRMFLREFAAQQGVGIFLDPEVKGELTGRYELNARAMMELLGRTFGLVWYFDGRVLYVYPASGVESSVIRLNEVSAAQFQRTLDRLGISDARFPLSFDDRGSVLVSGPKRYVELVRDAARSSDRPADGDAESGAETRVFQLRFAFADDHVISSGGREIRVPGVVSVLRQAYGADAAGIADMRRQTVDAAAAIPPQPVLPLLRGDGGRSGVVEADPTPPARRPSAQVRGLPSFAADPRTNAVVVRDLASRIGQYELLVRRLDERPRLVEIEANIVEVNADDFGALGIDWSLAARRGSGDFTGRVGDGAASPDGPPGVSGLGRFAEAVLNVMAGTRTQLMARISALEQAGKASTSAQPKIMTLNNVEAALDARSTFYVPVQGFQDARLFEVSAGTSIRITPSVVSPLDGAGTTTTAAAERDQVRLLIRIEDGGLTSERVSQLPVVQRTTINTQSLVPVGNTLLIAGYAQERDSRVQRGVPGLSRLPLLGGLFRSNERNSTRVERLFMITPRVVELRANDAAPSASASSSAGPATVAPLLQLKDAR